MLLPPAEVMPPPPLGMVVLTPTMRPLASREPGPIAQALESTEAWYGLIVDDQHVHPAMLRLALRGLGRPLLVTDAMPPVGGTRSRLDGDTASSAGTFPWMS